MLKKEDMVTFVRLVDQLVQGTMSEKNRIRLMIYLGQYSSSIYAGEISSQTDECKELLAKLKQYKEGQSEWQPDENRLHYWIDETVEIIEYERKQRS